MAKITSGALVELFADALNQHVAAGRFDLGNVSHNVAESLVEALDDAGMMVITDERDRRLSPAQQAAIDRLRGSASA